MYHHGNLLFRRVLEYNEPFDYAIPVPCCYFPVIGRFNLYSDNGMFSMGVDDVETPFQKDDLCRVFEGEEFIDYPYEPESTEKCIIMIPIEKLKEVLGLEIKTGEGWGWNPETLENDFCESPDRDHKWNSFSKTWEKVCENCFQLKYLNPNYNLLDYMTDDYLFRLPFCECDRCPRCKRFMHIDPYGHDDC